MPRTSSACSMKKPRVGVAAVVVVSALAFASAAAAFTYAGPKTWLPSWDANTGYQTNWYADTMGGKGTTGYSSRVAFIDPAGNWHWSYTDTLPNTTTFAGDNASYKAYCKNNDTVSYVATCYAS